MSKTEFKDDVPISKKIDELYELIEGIEIAMLTTRRPDGRLVSRPMATQKREPGTDVWFVTDIESGKIDELATDPNVSLSYYNVKSWEWVSVSGTATITTDRAMIRELYKPDWKAWFGDEGGNRDGGPNDPRFALILVDATSVVYGKRNKPKPLALFEVVKGLVTGKEPDVADVRRISGREMEGPRA
ncbi:MAG TPA: pyridoxamine 5'-phosphate oxidase family protein [Gemmatimonadaceae bacterium]|nr:pyridoxamine 5'-phosphate oxidase family protein [Gemmatimonadaceae bacterium]